ncbi:MAG: helix-turn-helix transcriptional regulator [Lachnospiraceae bacterium]|nr:helix-turn-helix transcriptional regulator [Lachnospiraceae bacterium]
MNQQKVGQFLKTLRSQKSITQAELAEVLGVSNRSVSRWENGTTMPDFDLIIELAKYYEVEVGEILDGERKDNMNSKTEETMLKIADYNNVEREFFSKRMCIMFGAAILGMVAFSVIYILGLERTQPYASVVNLACGFVSGTLFTGLVYASRYVVKLKAARMRLIKTLRKLK